MKRVCVWLAGLFMAGFSLQVMAAPCQTIGGTKEFSIPYNKIITDPNENVAGRKSYEESWNTPNNVYYARCSCQDSHTNRMIHYRADSALPNKVPSTVATPDPSKTWYIIPSDKGDAALGVATQVYIAGNRKEFHNVPFTMDNMKLTNTLCPGLLTNANRVNLGTGAQGKISLMFIKPFIGHVHITHARIIDLYAATDESSFSATPIARVYVDADVQVPQSCKINDGMAIEVPFGNIDAKDILTKGQLPAGFTKKQITVNYKCTNIASGVKLVLSMEATPSADLPNAIATTNKDIGVMVEDQNHHPFIPHTTNIPITISAPSPSQPQQGSSTLYAWPVNTTGNYPQRGPFNATASLNINLQ